MRKKTPKPTAQAPEPGKTRFELRFDTGLYEQIKALASTADISINQLMEGIARWAIPLAIPGVPNPIEEAGPVALDHRPGSVVFGQLEDEEEQTLGTVYFVLDFNPRWAIRQVRDYEPPIP
jgi:hypothetical protein